MYKFTRIYTRASTIQRCLNVHITSALQRLYSKVKLSHYLGIVQHTSGFSEMWMAGVMFDVADCMCMLLSSTVLCAFALSACTLLLYSVSILVLSLNACMHTFSCVDWHCVQCCCSICMCPSLHVPV